MSTSESKPGSDAGEETALAAETVAAIELSRQHAADLIDAAKLIQSPFPHLAYHFAVLALEEIGRGVLLVIRDSVTGTGDETRALEDGMEDHVRKLFWALWSPTQAGDVTGAQIDEFRELARQIHDVRKSGLYFDPGTATLPREAVSVDEASNTIGLAEARLGMEMNRRWVPADSQQADDVRWFSEATSDARSREVIFGGASLKQLSELGDVPGWIRWLREQLEEGERQADEALARELGRTLPEEGEALETKWSMTFRLFSESHSIRARPLNGWNQRSEWIQLRRATHTELIVQLTMPKRVLAAAVWPAALTLAQRLILALNIGTMGFFWWHRRGDTSRFYEELRDTETDDEVALDRSPPLAIDWGENHVLDDRAINRVLFCFAMLPSDVEHPSNDAFGHYLRGLGLIAKSDIHLQFDRNIFEEFFLALREGMRAYGDWDGEKPFAPVFEAFATRFFTDEADRPTYVGAVELAEAGRLEEIDLTFDQAVMLKGLADAYFLPKFEALAEERAAREDASARHA